MRRRHIVLLALGAAGAALAWGVWPRGGARQAEARAPAEPSASRLDAAYALEAQGVASCAAASCHNANGPKGSKGSEYTTWLAHDPHAKAYAVLFDARSKLIEKNLRGLDDVKGARPEKDKLCLSCHAHPDPDLKGPKRPEGFAAGDGVGCEACHGPAEKWRSTHYLSEFSRKTAGFLDTKDLRVRAEVCAGCHVGRRGMEVNHDLIAAGHPRLRFEYGAYLANYHSRHWKLGDDKGRHKDHEARAWLVGQLASAEAALELLEHRAQAKDGWPEFAEYNCAACHHALPAPGGRLTLGLGEGKPKPGALPWGTWYHALLPAVGAARFGAKEKELAPLRRLAELMRQRVPDEGKVAAEAKAARKLVRAWLDKTGAAGGEAQLRKLLAALARQEDTAKDNWEGATQLYLGLAALHHGLGDLSPEFRKRAGLKGPLEGLRRELEAAFPKGKESAYDSPSKFDPGKAGKRLREVHGRLK